LGFTSQLLATRPVGHIGSGDGEGASEYRLSRTLSAPALTMLGIGVIIGTGIFVLTGVAAAEYAGPALVLSFIIAGVGCALAGLCYAEFAAMIPVSGSAYAYAYVTLGEGVAWFIGWNLILEYLFAVATVSVGWSGYVVSLLEQFGIHIPGVFSTPPFVQVSPNSLDLVRSGAIVDVPAVLIVTALAAICYAGMRKSSRFNIIIVTLKVAVVTMFIVLGLGFVHQANWHPFIPTNSGRFGRYGWSGILAASGVIFFAYIGFDAISTTSQEARNPQRDMPIAMLLSLGICTLLYVAVAAVLTGMVSYKNLNVAAPIAVALDSNPRLRWLGIPVKLGAIFGMTSAILVQMLAQARVFYSMARDGLLPPVFGRIHRKFRSPSTGTIVTAIFAALMGGLLPVGLLGQLVSIGTLAAFVTVCIGVLVLRYTRPELPRPFKVPAPWVVCTGGATVCLAMIVSLPPSTWIRLAVWTVIGAAVYALYGYRNSRLHRRRSRPMQPTGRAG
jgi:basic amino acid/polyamine antiporter, APA family